MADADRRIARALVRAGVVSQDDVEQAQARGDALLRALAAVTAMPEEELAAALAEVFGFTRPAEDIELELQTVMLVPPEIEARGAVALQSGGADLFVGVTDPTDLVLFDELEFVTAYNIHLVVLTDDEMARLSAEAARLREADARDPLPDDVAELMDGLVEPFSERTAETFSSTVLDTEAERRSRRFDGVDGFVDLEAEAIGAPVVKLTNLILVDAVKKGARCLRLTASDERVLVEYRIDDEWCAVMSPPLSLGAPLVWRLKDMCELLPGPVRWPSLAGLRLRLGGDREQAYRLAFEPIERGTVVVLQLCEPGQLGGEPMPPLPFWGRLDAAQRATDVQRKLQLLAEATAMAEERKRHYWAAHCLELTAAAFLDSGDSREVDKALARAREHQDAHDATIVRLEGLAVCCDLSRARGDFAAAARYALDAQARAVADLGPVHWDSLYCTRMAARAVLDAGREQEAKGMHLQAAALQREVVGGPSWSGARIAMMSAQLAVHDDPEAAVRDASAAVALFDAVAPGPPTPVSVQARGQLADVLRLAGRLDEAAATLTEARSLADELDDELPPWAEPDEALALLCAERGDVAAARAAVARLRARFDKTPPSEREPSRLAFLLGCLAEAEGRESDARHSYDAARFGYHGAEARRRLERLG